MLKINDQIRYENVRVSDQDQSYGILPIREAIRLAEEKVLDLILITENANPPVCILEDVGKYRYFLQKKEKQSKKKQAEAKIEIKEIRIRPNTDQNDLTTKARQINEFIKKGNHVKISVKFRGREITHSNQGIEILKKLLDKVENYRYVKKEAFESRMLSAIVAKGDTLDG